MDEQKAFQLLDTHLDRLPLTDEQSDELTAWIKADTSHADAAFFRVFLHAYLRFRIQAGLPTTTLTIPAHPGQLIDVDLRDPPGYRRILPKSTGSIWSWIGGGLLGAALVGLGIAFWQWERSAPILKPEITGLWAYENFDYPPTSLPQREDGQVIWPTTGGLHGLNGGFGWSEPWRETNSKVAIIVDYDRMEVPWNPTDMRKFSPLKYTDIAGNQLLTGGCQARTATSPRSISARRFDFRNFPESFRDENGLGKDGSVVWFSFLAQSSSTSAEHNHYSYLVIGSKDVSGFRVGKLGAAPSGNWSAVGLLTGAEVNLKTSDIPSGQMMFIVTRIHFQAGAEEAFVWIDPPLDRQPSDAEAALRLEIPDFRFDGIAIHANHSTDFDEIRFGSSFEAVAPRR